MLLRELSRILADRTRASDTLARLGGDEFGLLLFDCDLAEAEQVASKLIEQICSVRFPGKGGSTTWARASASPPLPPPRAAPAN